LLSNDALEFIGRLHILKSIPITPNPMDHSVLSVPRILLIPLRRDTRCYRFPILQ
jgi:hypothetical protein